MEKNKSFRFSPLTFANILILVFLVGAIISPFTKSCSSGDSFLAATGDNPLLKSKNVESAEHVQKALREIYVEVNPAVVRIETEQIIKSRVHPLFNDPMFRHFFQVPEGQTEKRQGLGSGFVVSDDGYIVTNNHVVGGVDKITIKFNNGKSTTAKIIGSDATSDIALLKVDLENLKSVHIGDSDKIEVGDIAIAIGNPFGLASTFTSGVISSKGQDVESGDGVPRIQTDAAINPGNSGGPLLNIRGQVIGINQMIYSKSGGSVGIGFAIPINYAMAVLDKLKSGKIIKPGFIGVSIVPNPSEEQLKELDIDKDKPGLLVGQVLLGTPARKAGLRAYDFIVEIDGKAATKFSMLKAAVIKKGVGNSLQIKVLRNKEVKVFTVTIGEQKPS